MPKLTASTCLFFTLALLTCLSKPAQGQSEQVLVHDISTLMEIPGLESVTASETHLYALSSEDGLVVFRVHADSLQWLYSSQGMQRRGNRLTSDVRFAYLTGSNSRLTIVEPTSVLGVYSSTTLPAAPVSLARVGDFLFMGMETPGLFRLSLATPEAVDERPVQLALPQTGRNRVSAVRAFQNTLLVLTANNSLHQFRVQESGELQHQRSFQFGPAISNLFVIDGRPLLTGAEGTVYALSAEGDLNTLFRIDGAVDELKFWQGRYLIRTRTGQLWQAREGGQAQLIRRDTAPGNLMALSKGQLWLTEFNQLGRMQFEERPVSEIRQSPVPGQPGRLKLSPIPDQLTHFPRPVLLPLTFEHEIKPEQVRFQLQTSAGGASIRDQGFLWQPASRDVGRQQFTIIASTPDGQTDSVTFEIEVRPFNTPPRFNQVRPLSIPVGETFSLPLRATDPDGTDSDLIRYLAADLPDGAVLNERTGLITWTPTRRQEGQHRFQVIATDQFGAATQMNVTITVLQLSRE
ncbi:MAG: cadherin repeat domain-containing protein [Balneolales bacterium]|nr:cadherin repeat domain-containing protein [Balneolales bacterium]